MSSLQIVPTNSDSALYQQVTTLDGTDYLFTFAFNGRDGYWYLDLADQDGLAILSGVKCVVGMPFLRRCRDPRAPAGTLMFLDTSGQDLDPGQSDLGGRVILTYLPNE